MLLSRLSKVKQTGSGKYLALCPAHHDKSPSLAIKETDDGRILLYCFAGCALEAILAALLLSIDDLFPDRIHNKGHDRYKSRREIPRFSRYDLFPKLVFEASVLSVAIADLLEGHRLSDADIERVQLAQDTIMALRLEVDA
jgi:CHC2 zinc finger